MGPPLYVLKERYYVSRRRNRNFIVRLRMRGISDNMIKKALLYKECIPDDKKAVMWMITCTFGKNKIHWKD